MTQCRKAPGAAAGRRLRTGARLSARVQRLPHRWGRDDEGLS